MGRRISTARLRFARCGTVAGVVMERAEYGGYPRPERRRRRGSPPEGEGRDRGHLPERSRTGGASEGRAAIEAGGAGRDGPPPGNEPVFAGRFNRVDPRGPGQR